MVLKDLINDATRVLKSPEAGFQQILSGTASHSSKMHLIFIVLMHIYYLLLPSYLLVLNILALLLVVILIGMMYYFSQECFLIYKEQKGIELDDKFFYTIAYCFALANVPALALNLINNFLSIVLADNLLFGLFFACVINLPIVILGLVYPLKLMKLISGIDKNLKLLLELVVTSFTTTCREGLGFKAIREMMIDWKSSSKA